MEFAENINLDTEEERKALETVDPSANLKPGGFERLTQFMSATR